MAAWALCVLAPSLVLPFWDLLPELVFVVGAFDDWGLRLWTGFFRSLLLMLVRKALFLLVGAVCFPTSAHPRGVFTAMTWSEHPRRDCSCIWAARQSLPMSITVGHSGSLKGKFLARSEKSGIFWTSSLDGTLSIMEGRLCCIMDGGKGIDVDSSSGLAVIPFIILHGASVDLPCTVMVASLDGRRWSLGIPNLLITDGSRNVALDWSSMIARPVIDMFDEGCLKITGHVRA